MDKTLIIIEDDTFLSQMYAEKFEAEREFSVFVGGTMAEGLALIEKHPPDCILLDIALPDGSGLDALEQLRIEGKIKNAVVILLTNNDATRDIERATRLGAKDYLIKAHFTPQEVVARVRRVL